MFKSLRVVDGFCGAAGGYLGAEAAGHKVVYAFDNDKYKRQAYKAVTGHEPEGTDATKIKPGRAPDHDIFLAGFPCQAFSIAGRRRGFEDTRGTVFFEIARIVREKLPAFLVLENVKGLLNHANGQTFRTILTTLHELGYDLEWQVLNSKHFGVPQHRERVYIVGHLRGLRTRKIFPLRRANAASIREVRGSSNRAYRVYHPKGLAPTVTTVTGGAWSRRYWSTSEMVSLAVVMM